MEFETTHNKQLYLEQCMFIWREGIKKERKKNIAWLSVLSPFLFVGIGAIYLDLAIIGFLILAVPLYFLLIILTFWFQVKKSKTKYMQYNEDLISYLEDGVSKLKWGFGEKHFKFSDVKSSSSIDWTLVKGFKINDTNLFFEMKNSFCYIFIYEQKSDITFQELVTFLKTKINLLEN